MDETGAFYLVIDEYELELYFGDVLNIEKADVADSIGSKALDPSGEGTLPVASLVWIDAPLGLVWEAVEYAKAQGVSCYGSHDAFGSPEEWEASVFAVHGRVMVTAPKYPEQFRPAVSFNLATGKMDSKQAKEAARFIKVGRQVEEQLQIIRSDRQFGR